MSKLNSIHLKNKRLSKKYWLIFGTVCFQFIIYIFDSDLVWMQLMIIKGKKIVLSE